MGFLLSHWHCVLPAAAIIVAAAFMRDKPRKGGPGRKKAKGASILAPPEKSGQN
jgi:hypothetical protein